MKVLGFGQHAISTDLHGYYDLAILQSLSLRGAEVFYYACPGLEICDLFTPPGKFQNCANCIEKSFSIARKLNFKLLDMKNFMRPNDDEVIANWLASLDALNLPQAKFGRFPIADWVMSSFNTTFGTPQYSPSDPLHVKIFLLYLAAGLRLALYSSRIMEGFTPEDRLLLYNGRMSISNIPRQIALEKHIPVYLHERGVKYGTRMLIKNGPLYDMSRDQAHLEAWKDMPLQTEELKNAHAYFEGREHGNVNVLNWTSYLAPKKGSEAVRQNFQLDDAKKLWVVFTSSTDEIVGQEVISPDACFDSQHHWLMHLVKFMREINGAHLIIRAHPRLAKTASSWEYSFFKTLKERYGNITVALPDSHVNSYDLMNAADAGIVFLSSCGYEMARKGKPIIVGGDAWYKNLPGFIQADTPEKLKDGLQKLQNLPAGHYDHLIARSAYRFVNFMNTARGLQFSTIKTLTYNTAQPAYSSSEELLPGKDPALDYFCEHIIAGDDPLLYPPEQYKTRTTEDEDNWEQYHQ